MELRQRATAPGQRRAPQFGSHASSSPGRHHHHHDADWRRRFRNTVQEI